MKKILIIGCGIVVLTACGSSKKTSSHKEAISILSTETKGVHAIKSLETTRYGDTLKGSVPLFELTETPVKYEVESGGMLLEITTKKGELTYKVIPKAIETTKQLIETKELEKSTTDLASITENQTTTKREQWRPPWWTYILFLLAGLAAGVYFSQPIKLFLKPFKFL